MTNLFHPGRSLLPDGARLGVAGLLLISAALIAAAPAFIPSGYSWTSNAVSESAAQGLTNAWVARLGFVCFGLAALWLGIGLRAVWNVGAVCMHSAFGVFMIMTAVFSHQPWIAGAPSDLREDFLHSAAATSAGFAFVLGIVARLLQRGRDAWRARIFDAVVIGAGTLLPLAMAGAPSLDGLLQRLMFLVSYAWYGCEAMRPLPIAGEHRTPPRPNDGRV